VFLGGAMAQTGRRMALWLGGGASAYTRIYCPEHRNDVPAIEEQLQQWHAFSVRYWYSMFRNTLPEKWVELARAMDRF
jgi:hypothetical protein